MQSLREELAQDEWECLPSCAWLFIGVAFAPHVLAMAGQDLLTKLAISVCFPLSMGPFAFVHSYILNNRLGFDAHMAWVSALLFSMIWFPIFRWLLSKDNIKALVFCTLCLIVFVGTVWLPVAS